MEIKDIFIKEKKCPDCGHETVLCTNYEHGMTKEFICAYCNFEFD